MTQPGIDFSKLRAIDVSKIHQKADTDGQPSSAHHTLGPGATQASPGDHIHDGRSSKKLYPNPAIITGSRAGNVALTNLLTSLAAQGIIVNNTTA